MMFDGPRPQGFFVAIREDGLQKYRDNRINNNSDERTLGKSSYKIAPGL